MSMLLITHDMGVIAGHADRVNVMYAGRRVETAETGTLFRHMHHPYTQALLASIPQLSQDNTQRLLNITGLPPDLSNPPDGCRFAARCSRATDKCRADEPSLTGETLDHLFACWHPVDGPLSIAKAMATRLLGWQWPPARGSRRARAGRAGRAGAVPEGEPLLQMTGLVKEFPVTARPVMQRKTGALTPCRACRSRQCAARRSGWWASLAAARQRSAS